MEEHNNKPEQQPEKSQDETVNAEVEQQNVSDVDDPQAAIETYQQTASTSESGTTYDSTGSANAEPEGVHVAPAAIGTPFHAIKAIILKPNPVFAKLKGTANWSWLPFLIVAICSALPSWLYFNSVDMNWYTDLIIQMEYSEVSPSEKAQMKQMMMQDNMGDYTAIVTIISLVMMYAILALYLHKITQIDEDNTLSYGDWYGFLWWISIPFAIFSLLTALLIVLQGGPEIRPEMLSFWSLSSLLGISLDSDWFSWAQGIGLDTIWAIYLMTVGVNQWTQLNSRQCFTIAAAPFAIIWGVWAAFIIF